jgi:hypothetical protein
MINVSEIKLKGVLSCPVCGKEFIFVYRDAKGHTSVPCVRCSRIVMVNCETMKAVSIPPKRRRNIS